MLRDFQSISPHTYLEQRRPKGFKLKLNCIRPGTWRSGMRENQVGECGDGTIIATGVISNDNKRFCDLGDELANYLKRKLDYIFEPSFRRKSPNIWSTLGYLDRGEDLKISNKLTKWFESKRNVNLYIEINKLHMVKYIRRTLDDAVFIGEPLSLYA
jgi:hypothetical protein